MDYVSRYAELAVRVGVNLQEGQKLVVFGEPEHAFRPARGGGRPAGGRCSGMSSASTSTTTSAACTVPRSGRAALLNSTVARDRLRLGIESAALVATIGDPDPELFSDVDPSRAARAEPRRWKEIGRDLTSCLATAWTLIACPTEGAEPLRRARHRSAVVGDRGGHAPLRP